MLQYWSVLSAIYIYDQYVEFFFNWLPFYYEFKVIILVWLLHPKLHGPITLFDQLLHPLMVRIHSFAQAFLFPKLALVHSYWLIYVHSNFHGWLLNSFSTEIQDTKRNSVSRIQELALSKLKWMQVTKELLGLIEDELESRRGEENAPIELQRWRRLGQDLVVHLVDDSLDEGGEDDVVVEEDRPQPSRGHRKQSVGPKRPSAHRRSTMKLEIPSPTSSSGETRSSSNHSSSYMLRKRSNLGSLK
jgi:TB2/DP1, HVA22 family